MLSDFLSKNSAAAASWQEAQTIVCTGKQWSDTVKKLLNDMDADSGDLWAVVKQITGAIKAGAAVFTDAPPDQKEKLKTAIEDTAKTACIRSISDADCLDTELVETCVGV
eukprot:3236235-Pyramimonas_sp.AAC.1